MIKLRYLRERLVIIVQSSMFKVRCNFEHGTLNYYLVKLEIVNKLVQLPSM